VTGGESREGRFFLVIFYFMTVLDSNFVSGPLYLYAFMDRYCSISGTFGFELAALNLELSPYLRGMVVDIAKYNVWIGRIKDVQEVKIGELLDMVPKGWKVPTDYMCALEQFLGLTEKAFLPMFEEYLEILRGPS
jgi:hypothetical protein